MMKKLFISLLSVGMFLGIFGVVGVANTGSPNTIVKTVQADTTNNDSRTINYEVYKENSGIKSIMDPFFTKTATIYTNDDGTYKVVLTAKVSHLTGLQVSSINNQEPKESAAYEKNGERYVDISFNINSLTDLDNTIKGVVQTKLLNLNVDKQDVDFKFDSSTLDSQGTTSSFSDSLKSVTDAENKAKSALDDAKSIVDNTKDDTTNDIIAAPATTDTQATTDTTTTNDNNDGAKTVLKELTYKIAKNNGDGALISPYFTNTAKVMENPDGTYYVEVTMKYPKKFGNTAIQINAINNQRPSNLSFTSVGDSNYLKFDFPIKKLTDLSNLIPGDISLNIPDFGLNKDLGFNFDFDSLNPADLSKLLDSSDISGLLSDLSNLSNPSSIKTASAADTVEKKTGTLPQTGNSTDSALMIIGGLVLIMWFMLLKGTYLKN